MKPFLITFIITLLSSLSGLAQQRISLHQCYEWAREQYPLVKKLNLLEQIKDYSLANANKAYLPQLSVVGQATYQSETVDFSQSVGRVLPPSVQLPVIDKDQYKIIAEASQLLYNGGATHHQKELIKANAELQSQQIEVQLYTLRQRISDLYFSILLIEAQMAQNHLSRETLQAQLQKAEVALQNGTTLPSNVDELKAEILRYQMQHTEYEATQRVYLQMLSTFIGKDLSASELQMPQSQTPSANINRPELKTFALQEKIFDLQARQLRSEYLPRVSLFVQGAYGRPTLNIINNTFDFWYLGGVRLQWSLTGLYAQGSRRHLFELNKENTRADRETFLFNTQLQLDQQDAQQQKLAQLITQDEEVVTLRRQIAQAAQVQLDNGVITTTDYLQKVNAEQLAKQMLILHQIQLLQAQENSKILSSPSPSEGGEPVKRQ